MTIGLRSTGCILCCIWAAQNNTSKIGGYDAFKRQERNCTEGLNGDQIIKFCHHFTVTVMSAEERLQTMKDVLQRAENKEGKYADEESPPFFDNEPESEYPMIDHCFQIHGDQTILEMAKLSYDEYVKL